LQNLQGKAAYKDPKWSAPSPDPGQSGGFMHRGCPAHWGHHLKEVAPDQQHNKDRL
jgi:hypothetical protein